MVTARGSLCRHFKVNDQTGRGRRKITGDSDATCRTIAGEFGRPHATAERGPHDQRIRQCRGFAGRIRGGARICVPRERIGYEATEDIIYLDSMPMTTTGKVDRTMLKHWAQENQLAERV